MIAANTVYWCCLGCSLVGDTDKTAEQHTRKTGHTSVTGTSPEALARIAARIAARVREAS